MPSHKQKREKKKYHKHKRRNHDRSAAKRPEKKNEGKKENIPHNKSARDRYVRDVGAYIGNRREMIRQMFSSVGEEFMASKVPLILKATRDELKKICLEELTRMSSGVIIKILDGIPVDSEPNNPMDDFSRAEKSRVQSFENLHGDTSRSSSTSKKDMTSEECEQSQLDLGFDEEEIEFEDDGLDKVESSSSEGSLLQNDGEIFSSINNETKSASCHLSTSKKLAKIAPFNVCMMKVEDPEQTVEANQGNNDEDSDSYDMVDLGLEEEIDEEGMENTTETEAILLENTVGENNDNQVVSEEEMQQNLSEMCELEHRARAIRSMLANMDKLPV